MTDVGHLKEARIIFYSNLLGNVWGVKGCLAVKGTEYEFQLLITGRLPSHHTSPSLYQSLPTTRVKGS